MSNRRKLKMQNPHIAVTGNPETPAMSVNAVDEFGKETVKVIRSQTGQLFLMKSDSVPVRLPEDVFNRTVIFWHKKYGGLQ